MTATTYATKWTANAIETPPDLTALVSSGYPTNGDPSKGIPPTLPGAPWFHWITQSLASVIVGNGLTLDQTKTDQLLGALKNLGKTIVPIGSVIFYLGTTIPDGYLLCNGASLSRTEYPELFEVLGTKCGAVDSAHFTLPDTHHRFLEGTTSVSEVGQYIAAGLPNIKGRITYTAANDPRATSYEANSALYYAYPEQAVKTQYDYSTENKIPADPAIDASRSSSLYQDDLTEVRVNAVFGLNLIRAF